MSREMPTPEEIAQIQKEQSGDRGVFDDKGRPRIFELSQEKADTEEKIEMFESQIRIMKEIKDEQAREDYGERVFGRDILGGYRVLLQFLEEAPDKFNNKEENDLMLYAMDVYKKYYKKAMGKEFNLDWSMRSFMERRRKEIEEKKK